jgi:hypothetical protein
MQTVFLHRWTPHGMFRLSKGCERTFYRLTYVFQAWSSENSRSARAAG